MTSRDFAYWLQGYFEIQEPTQIPEKETELIKRHLALVFKHEIDPSMGDDAHQAELNSIHSGIDADLTGLHNPAAGPFPNPNAVFRC